MLFILSLCERGYFFFCFHLFLLFIFFSFCCLKVSFFLSFQCFITMDAILFGAILIIKICNLPNQNNQANQILLIWKFQIKPAEFAYPRIFHFLCSNLRRILGASKTEDGNATVEIAEDKPENSKAASAPRLGINTANYLLTCVLINAWAAELRRDKRSTPVLPLQTISFK